MLCFDKKGTSKVKNTLLQWIFQNILEDVSENIIKVDSYEMDFMKGIFILVKVDEMYNILKSASHFL